MSDFFLADDLSGALDAAAGFHGRGRNVTIVLSTAAWRAAPAGDLIGVTTETRNASPPQAAAAVSAALRFAGAHGARLIYKKIDSTLRGPVAAEVAALAAALPGRRILFAPANPGVGRTVRDGILRVGGVPVAETEFGRDPVAPVRESSIRRLLGDAAGPRVVIADAESDADLVAAVSRMDAAGGDWVPVGSGALARVVAGRESGAVRAAPAAGAAASGNRIPLLFVCGSAHPVNRAQAACVVRELGAVLREVSSLDPAAAVTAAIGDFERAACVGLLLSPRDAMGGTIDNHGALHAMVDAAAGVIDACGVRHLLMTGGETAFALCRRLGIEALRVRGEIEPGLVLAEAGAGGARWHLAIKPGAFGGEQAWLRAAAHLIGA